MTVPFFAGTARLLIAAVGGWIVVAQFGGGLTALFVTVAAGTIMFGIVNALATVSVPWSTGSSPTPAAAKA